jgi:hypothetical protein
LQASRGQSYPEFRLVHGFLRKGANTYLYTRILARENFASPKILRAKALARFSGYRSIQAPAAESVPATADSAAFSEREFSNGLFPEIRS